MTHELGPAARALLDAARGGLTPDPDALRRVRDKVDSSVAAGAAASALATKLGLLALVAALATGAILYGSDDRSAMSPRLELPAETRAVVTAPSHETAPIVTAAPEIEMAREVARPRPRDVTPQLAIVTESPPTAPARHNTIDLAREVVLVDQAMAALRSNDPAAALTAARTHARETAGAGQLAEDAAAIEVEALCRLHDPAVVAKLDAFDAKWPTSAQRSRLSTSCP